MALKPPTSADVGALASVLRTTASFVPSDRHSIRIAAATRPRGFGVFRSIGYTTDPRARRLATVHVSAHDVSLVAGGALVHTIERRPVVSPILLPTSLVVRASTAAARPGVRSHGD
jgi:DNA-binding LacI/PurR family transcriptional regulator